MTPPAGPQGHTPGPWEYLQALHDPRFAQIYGGGRIIADVWNHPGSKGSVATANAELIASAPQLQADLVNARAHAAAVEDARDNALAILKEALEQTGCDGDLCGYAWHDKARAALAATEAPK